MGKLVTIATKARFDALREASNISETSLNFILETGLLYTHNIFINGASFGTATSNYIPVKIGGITKNLSLNGHTHSNYYDNSSDIDIGSNKIKSRTLELLKYSSDTLILGNSSIPTEFFGTLKTTKDGTKYTILDTNNFSIVNKTSTNLTLNNVALFKYGSSSFQLDYVRRYNTVETFNNLAKYTSAGTTNENSKAYGFITLSTDTGTNTYSYAQIRVSIPDNTLEFRTSSDTTWKGTLLGGVYRNITINGTTYSIVTKAGSLPTIIAPTALGTSGQYLTTSDDGKSLTWRTLPTDNNTWRPIAVNGTEKRSSSTGSGNLDIINGTNTTVEWTSGNKLKINAVDTWIAFAGASDSVAGTAGYVSAPGKGNQGKFFRGDGTWATPTNTWNAANTILAGYVPRLTTGGGTISTQASEYVLVYVSSGSGTVAPVWKLLPANAFKNDNTWTPWVGATASANGTAGYMPAPTSAQRGQFLRGDGSWVSLNNYSLPAASSSTLGGVKTGAAITDTTGYTAVAIKDGVIYYKDTNTTYSFSNLLFLQTSGTNLMTYNSQATRTVLAGSNITFTHSNNVLTITAKDTTYSTVSKSAAGLCPALPNETTTTKYLRLDGTWVTPPNDNTWKAANASQEGYVPKSTANKILRANGDGALYWGDDANTTYTFYNLQFQNSSGTTVDTYKPTTSPTKTLKAGANVTISAASNVITIASTNTWNANAVGVAGYVAAPTKAANANMTWLTDADGNPAWRASNNHSHSYLPLSGGQMTGPLTWKNETALPQQTSPLYFVVIDAFASGGTTKWSSVANVKTALGLGSNAYTSTAYLPLAGGTMGGTLNMTCNTVEMNFRTGHSSYNSKMEYMTNGNEAMVWANQNAVTSFIFKCGLDLSNTSDWTGITPSLQIKNQSVYINSLITNGTTPSYNLYVNGSANATTLYENGNRVITTANISNQSVNYATSAGTASSCSGNAATATRFAYITDWNSPKHGANVINLMSDTSSSATTNGAPLRYASGISIVTSYVGFQLASYGGGGEALYFRKVSDADTWSTWRTIIHSGNIGSQSVNYASSAGAVAWGNVTGKPSTFAPSSHTHNMNDIKWPGSHNLTTSATANGQEWSIDCTPGTYTGTYWLVWRATSSGISTSGTMLKVDCDTGKVSAPYGFVGNLSGTATSAGNADTVDSRHATGFMYWEGNPSKNNMNDIARSYYSATGMTNLASSSVDNGDMSGWTHFFSTSYTDGGNGTNAWVFLLACPAGSSNLQFRSRNGGTVTNGTAWTTGWTKILHAGNSSVSKSGDTLTVKINGTSQSLTNTNTWRGIQNNLTSNSTSDSLSAAQGKALANGSARDNTKIPLYRYGGTGSTTKIKININSTASWMLCFVVTLYQGYRATKIMVSGYQYGSNHWYQPEARILGDSDGTETISVYFGYDDTNKLWVGFDGGSYTGVSINDVTNGYTQIGDFMNLFTISNVSSLATLQTTITAASKANYANNADTTDGLHVHGGRNNEANKIVRTDGNGYILCGWINTTSGNFTGTPNRIWASNDAYMRYMTPANFFPTLSNVSNQLSVTVGGQNRKLTIAYASSAGSVAWGNVTGNPFTIGGSVTDAYVNGTTYSTLNNGTYTHQLSGSSESVVHFQCGGSASGLDLKFHYPQGSDSPIYYRKTVDSNRFASTSWVTLIDSSNYSSYALPLSGGTMTGTISCVSNYYVADGRCGISMNNSDIIGCNSIRFGDLSDDYTESLMFYRSNGNWDSFRAKDGTFYFGVNNGTEYTAIHSGNISSQSVNYSSRAAYLDGHGTNPDNSHPGYGARVFYSWSIGQAGNSSAGYSNGITIGSHPNDQAYGFQIVLNMWDDRTYTRRYNGGWQEWKTLAWTSDLSSYLPLSGGTLSGNITISHATNATMTAASTNPKITFSESGALPVHLTYTDYDDYRSPAGLKVVGGTDASPAWFEAEGNMYAANFYTTSDINKKQNISSFSEHIRKFQLKETEKWHYGVIAQEVEEMFRDGEEGNMTVNYTSILSYYVGLLENKVASLEKELSILKQKLK